MINSVIKVQNIKKKYGQYFTPEIIANFMVELAQISKEAIILEPACGEGVFLKILQQKGFINLSAYEIDPNLSKQYLFVKHESFVSAEINTKFDLIIGNPPYIRWKNLEETLKNELLTNELWNKYFNSLCDYSYIFILKSIELLKDNGQLIFICPEYWMNTTHSLSLRNYMVRNGYFEKIYHFNETPIFNNVNLSIVIFKYVKGKMKKEKISITKFYSRQKLTSDILECLREKKNINRANYFTIPQFKENERWIIEPEDVSKKLYILENSCKSKFYNLTLNLFENGEIKYNKIGDFCDIANGLVSGLDKAFQVDNDILNEMEKNAVINVIKAKDLKPFIFEKITRYIFVPEGLREDEFKKKYPNYYNHFQKYKTELNNRYQYNRVINYWEWAFLRNIDLFKKNEKRIFVPCKERISNKNYFRFALVDENIFPTQDVTAIFKKQNTKESIEYILAYLNNSLIFEWLKYKGVVKGDIVEFSEGPISSIPFKAIDWSNPFEIEIHNKITQLTQLYFKQRDISILNQINFLFLKLLKINYYERKT